MERLRASSCVGAGGTGCMGQVQPGAKEVKEREEHQGLKVLLGEEGREGGSEWFGKGKTLAGHVKACKLRACLHPKPHHALYTDT
eukprot:1159084-Pelagomonas_calceolata.AAC.13